jgi:CBS domain-containing membrane protein
MMNTLTCCPTFNAVRLCSSAAHRRRSYPVLAAPAPAGLVAAALSAATGTVSLCVCEWLHHHWLALLALLSRNPFVFPSLGPTAYLLFFSPLEKVSSPRNTILGHAIAIVCGYGAFAVTGAGAQPFAAHLGIFWPRILAAALSLSTTAALMVLLGISHPPAGATTLIISLGIISKPPELVIIEVAVFLLVAQALMINRLAGLHYPFWTGPSIRTS